MSYQQVNKEELISFESAASNNDSISFSFRRNI